MPWKHKHDYFELYFLTHGTLQTDFSNSLLDIAAPAMMVIPPGEDHSIISGPVKRYLIYISEDNLNEFERRSLNSWCKKVMYLPDEAIELLNKMFLLSLEDKTNIIDKEVLLFGLLVFIMLGQNETPHSAVSLYKPDKSLFIARVVNYIENNYQKRLTIDMLASEFSVSSSSLRKHFKLVTNNTINDYIINVKLKRVKYLLEHTPKSIEEIADETGFCNASYLSKLFAEKWVLHLYNTENTGKYEKEPYNY